MTEEPDFDNPNMCRGCGMSWVDPSIADMCYPCDKADVPRHSRIVIVKTPEEVPEQFRKYFFSRPKADWDGSRTSRSEGGENEG